MIEQLQIGTPYFLTMPVDFTGVADETPRGLTTANQNTDVVIYDGITDLKQAQVQFSLQAGRVPTLWSTEKIPILSLLGYVDNERTRDAHWSKPYYLRSNRRLEGNFLNVGAEPAANVVFLCEKVDQLDSVINVDTEVGDISIIGIDSKFTNTLGEEPTREYSAPRNWPFLLEGFYSDLQRCNVKIVGVDSKEWMTDWTPVWALASRQESPLRRLRRPYLIQSGQTLGVNFQNNETLAEESGKLWLVGRRLA
jgi:hypothetical protein